MQDILIVSVMYSVISYNRENPANEFVSHSD